MTFHLRVAGAVALAAAACSAHAGVVTFEPDDFDVVFDNGGVRTVEGFDFTLESGNGDAFFVSGLYAPGDYVNSGSKNLFAANYASIGVAAHDGAAFGLNSFQLGGSFVDAPEHWARSVVAVGHLAGGGTLVETFELPSLPVMETVTLSGWQNLASFELLPNSHVVGDYDNRDFTIDNISVTQAVPEPGTTALMLAGLGAIGWTALRRRR